MPEELANPLFLGPGRLCVPPKAGRLAAVATSGVVLTLHDRQRQLGGMGHYIRPIRKQGHSNTMFAAPAIVQLTRMMYESGSSNGSLEAHLYGGASKKDVEGFELSLAEDNVSVGEEILRKLGVHLAGRDVGGVRARKILFDTASGDVVVAKVERVRDSDWYPDFRIKSQEAPRRQP